MTQQEAVSGMPLSDPLIGGKGRDPDAGADVGHGDPEADRYAGGDLGGDASMLEMDAGYDPALDEAAALRARRRRGWGVIALAVLLPGALAAGIALAVVGGGDSDTTTPTTSAATTEAATDVARPTAVVTTTTTTQPASTTADTATTTTTTAAPAATTPTQSATSPAAENTGTTAAVQPVDPVPATVEGRLEAWADVEIIEVASGETLWLLASYYDTSVEAIATLNGIEDPGALQVGQELRIPVGFTEALPSLDAPAGGVGADSAAAVITPVPEPALAAWQNVIVWTIGEGDSLSSIAVDHGTTVEAIMALNGISQPDLIFAGDSIEVPIGYVGGEELEGAPAQVDKESGLLLEE